MNEKKNVLFISSTGGHLTELLQLSPLFDNYDFHLITEKTPANLSLVDTYGKEKVGYMVYGSKSQPLTYLFHFSYNCIKTVIYYLRWKPDYVVTTGTHTAVPMCKLMHWCHKKVIWIETFANSSTPTASGKMIYPIADLFIVQWESMKKVYPNAVYGGKIF